MCDYKVSDQKVGLPDGRSGQVSCPRHRVMSPFMLEKFEFNSQLPKGCKYVFLPSLSPTLSHVFELSEMPLIMIFMIN